MDNRQIDRLVAEKVFGWKMWHFQNPSRTPGMIAFEYDALVPPEYDGSDLQHLDMIMPHYSTDIAAAWSVAEKMQETYRFNIDLCDYSIVMPDFQSVRVEVYYKGLPILMVQNKSAPLAICLAALHAAADVVRMEGSE